MSTRFVQYNSPEFDILVDTINDFVLDKWIFYIIESYIYGQTEELGQGFIIYTNYCKKVYSTRYEQKHGLYVEYDPYRENELLMIASFQHDQLHGEMTQYIGKQWWFKESYKHNLKEGIAKQWYVESDILHWQAHFHHNQLHGEYYQWYSTGELEWKGTFYQNQRHGCFYHYHQNHKLLSISYFRFDKQVFTLKESFIKLSWNIVNISLVLLHDNFEWINRSVKFMLYAWVIFNMYSIYKNIM